ncbi:MAG: MupA/Atu3671 family FMN-dependent luciferase-like monooxygenase [Sulfitobacter sp.]
MTAIFNPAAFSAILMGDESLTIACGDMMLAGGHGLSAVVTRDAAVRDWAEAQGVKVFAQTDDLVAAAVQADWFLSIANLRLIPEAVLALPTKGAINFHDGPLPRYAGLNTPAWAIINGEATHGVSWHMIEGGVDEGDLLAQVMVDIAPDETAFSLNSKCYAAGMESFGAVLQQLENGTPDRTPQDLSARSYFARDQRPDGMLNFGLDARALSVLVRGLDFGTYWNPLTTAKLALGNVTACVGSLDVSDKDAAAPGAIIDVSADQITIGTATAPVILRNLTDMAGAAIDLTTLAQVGDMLSRAAPVAPITKDEAHWRRALQQMVPLAVPLANASTTAPDYQKRMLTCAADLSIAQQAAAAALIALRSAGVGAGDLAIALSQPAPMMPDWVPLHISATAEQSVSDLVALIEPQLARAQDSAGFSADLPLRDPEIDTTARPDFAIAFGDHAVTDACVSVALTDGAATLIYDASRLSDQAVDVLSSRLESAFAAMPTAKECGTVWALPSSEEQQLLQSWNATQKDYDLTTIHAAFEAQVARTPDADALVFEDDVLSYATLNARANQLANVLRDMGSKPGTPIGLYTTRGVDLMIGALGILKAGGAYVPLDPAYPADRIAHYISDSATPIIVTQSGLVDQLSDHSAQVLAVDTDPRIAAAATENPDAIARPDDLAYLIYTSGSTGTPKGVMVSHKNVANFFAGMDDRIDHATDAVWLAVTSLSFDISVLELFWTLGRGFKLVLAGDAARTAIANGPIGTSDRKIDFNLFYWGNDDGVGPKKYELLLEGAKFADAHGFNAVWTPERHFHAFGGPYPNPSVTGAAVAAVTHNLDVRAGSCVAPLHHPARIAEEWAVIDNLTNGRVGLAIASGWQPDDFVLRPENTPPENKPAMYAAIDQLRSLWRGDAVEFPTKDGTPFAVVTQPRPVSRELPIWVTTAGNPQTWKEAGEIGANVLTHLLGQSVDEVADKIKIYHDALRSAGHDPADHKVTVMLHTYLADTRARAEEVAREPMKDYLRSAAGLIKQYAWAFPAFKKPAGVTNPFEVNLDGLSDEEMDAILEFAFQRYFNDSGMFGTIADGVARTEQLKRIGVDEVACLIDYGIATDKVMAGLKPLAKVLAQANETAALPDDDFSLAAQIVRHDVSHLQCTPSMAQMLVTNDVAQGALARVKHLMVGGEALPGSLVQALQGCTRATIQNMYGPTETTIWSTTHMLGAAPGDTAAIGTPIANTQVFILDDKMRPQPIGAEGELWIGGDGVTLGYWQRDAMTAERFVDNPFGAGKLYRTGDLAAWDAQGVLHFKGRVDAQVKIRGHRIELGEIEARLSEVQGVTQAVVIARNAPGGAQLVGYVTANAPVNAEAVRAQLAKLLPDIMVPSAIVTLDAMPLTPNKKIDRKALPAPQAHKPAPAAASATPASETQTKIAAIWSAILGVSDIRAEDNFFALGGHSLLAVQAHRDIKAALGADRLSITDIFRFPSLEGLAAHLDQPAGGAVDPVVAAPEPAKTETMSKRRMMRAGRSKAGA